MAQSALILGEGERRFTNAVGVQQQDLDGNVGATQFTDLRGAQGLSIQLFGASLVGYSGQILAAYWTGAGWQVINAAIAVLDRSIANPQGARLAAIVAAGNYWVPTAGLQGIAINTTALTSGSAFFVTRTIPDQTQI